jgi:hypothetical protein
MAQQTREMGSKDADDGDERGVECESGSLSERDFLEALIKFFSHPASFTFFMGSDPSGGHLPSIIRSQPAWRQHHQRSGQVCGRFRENDHLSIYFLRNCPAEPSIFDSSLRSLRISKLHSSCWTVKPLVFYLLHVADSDLRTTAIPECYIEREEDVRTMCRPFGSSDAYCCSLCSRQLKANSVWSEELPRIAVKNQL